LRYAFNILLLALTAFAVHFPDVHNELTKIYGLVVPFEYFNVVITSGYPSDVISPIYNLPGISFSSSELISTALESFKIEDLTTYFSSLIVNDVYISFILFIALLVSAHNYFKPNAAGY
jgi:hypothetical protein